MRILKPFSFIPRLAIITSVSLFCLPTEQSSAGPYLLSAHGGSNPSLLGNGFPPTGKGAQRGSISAVAGNCTHCHEQHASINGVEPVPVKLPSSGPDSNLLFDTLAGNAICNYCHNVSGVNGADNIKSQIDKTTGGRHNPNYGQGAALCNDCHDSHVAQKTNHSDASLLPSNLIGSNSPLLSVKGTSVQNWTAGAPTAGNELLGTLTLNALAKPAAREYELCFRCHAVQPPIALNLDVGLQFNPNNYAAHPVATQGNTWKNFYLRVTNPAALNAPWAANVDAEMYCSDCHGSETPSDPKGPHGSTIKYMLKAGPGPTLFDNLCLQCHKDPANPANTSWTDNWGTPLVGDHALPAHQSTTTNPLGTNNTYGCLACHGSAGSGRISNIHGANYVGNNGGGIGRPSYAFLVSDLTNNYYVGGSPFTAGNRFCSTVAGSGCHTGNAAYAY